MPPVAVNARVTATSGKWSHFTGLVVCKGPGANSKSWMVQWNDGGEPVSIGGRMLRVLDDGEEGFGHVEKNDMVVVSDSDDDRREDNDMGDDSDQFGEPYSPNNSPAGSEEEQEGYFARFRFFCCCVSVRMLTRPPRKQRRCSP